VEAAHEFWRRVAKSSARPVLDKKFNIRAAELLGNGNYGFVFKSRRVAGGQPVVVKLLSVRWAHVAAKEWQQAQITGDHPGIVRYEDAILHADDDKCITNLLKLAQEQGRLQRRSKGTKFPDKFLCLVEEFMNRGTVQDWMDKEILLPGGLLVVMQCVASALAFMHQRGVTHNDIKPENIFLHQVNEKDPHGQVTVKLGDLGLAEISKERAVDFQQYGMTVLCMVTGEKFGTRKFQLELISDFVNDVAQLTGKNPEQATPGVAAALAEVPSLLRKVLTQDDITMAEISFLPWLENWGFFDGGSKAEEVAEAHVSEVVSATNEGQQQQPRTGLAAEDEPPRVKTPLSARRLDPQKVLDMVKASDRRVAESAGEAGAGFATAASAGARVATTTPPGGKQVDEDKVSEEKRCAE